MHSGPAPLEADEPAHRRAHALRAAPAALAFVALVVVYWPAVASLLSRWTEQGPYDHGLIVFAAVAWMTARRLRGVPLRAVETVLPAAAALLGAAALWSLAFLANVGVAEQALAIAILCAVTVALIGAPAARRLGWPFLLLLSATPVWEYAIPPLQWIAVLGSSWAVAAAGIPAIIEANTVSIPAGVFEIAESCSGLRYILSAGTLAIIVGELFAASTPGRWILLAAGVAAAIAGNWVRIAIVVAVGHATDMEHPLVADHLWLGFVTFGALVVPALLATAAVVPKAAETATPRFEWSHLPRLSAARAAALAIALLVVPAAARVVEATRYRDAALTVALPPAADGWLGPAESDCPWSPHFPGADAKSCAMYESLDGATVVVSVIGYLRQSDGRELIRGAQTRPEGEWHATAVDIAAAPAAGVRAAVRQTVAPARGAAWRMWYWYRLGETTTARPLRMKLAEALALPPAEPAALIAIAAPCRSDCADADDMIGRYLDSHPALASAIERSRLAAAREET